MSIEFDNVLRSVTNINDIEKSIKVNNLSFANSNAKGEFINIEDINDLNKLHKKSIMYAKKTLKLITK